MLFGYLYMQTVMKLKKSQSPYQNLLMFVKDWKESVTSTEINETKLDNETRYILKLFLVLSSVFLHL